MFSLALSHLDIGRLLRLRWIHTHARLQSLQPASLAYSNTESLRLGLAWTWLHHVHSAVAAATVLVAMCCRPRLLSAWCLRCAACGVPH